MDHGDHGFVQFEKGIVLIFAFHFLLLNAAFIDRAEVYILPPSGWRNPSMLRFLGTAKKISKQLGGDAVEQGGCDLIFAARKCGSGCCRPAPAVSSSFSSQTSTSFEPVSFTVCRISWAPVQALPAGGQQEGVGILVGHKNTARGPILPAPARQRSPVRLRSSWPLRNKPCPHWGRSR